MRMFKRYFCLLFFILISLISFAHTIDTAHVGPLQFVENKGQWCDKVLYSVKIGGGTIFLEHNTFSFALMDPAYLQTVAVAKSTGSDFPSHARAFAYQMQFVNACFSSEVVPEELYPFYNNYYIGQDSSTWTSKVPVYHRLSYRQLYNGVDLSLSDHENHLKYEFYIHPFADPGQITMRYNGVRMVSIKHGFLYVETEFGPVTELPPYAYQLKDHDTIPVKCSFAVNDLDVSFAFGEYDPSLPLIIDPILVFSSYSGSIADNWGYTATYDAHGNLYGGGIVFGLGYPTSLGSYQIDYAGGQTDVAISKFDSTGSALLYSTYLGGSLLDIPHSLYVNENDELFVFGTTGSEDFPVTSTAYDTVFNGGSYKKLKTSLIFTNGSDIFVSKFNADGTALLASTFVGGSSNDGINVASSLCVNYADDNRGEIIVDDNSNVYVVSSTYSPDFPVTSNVVDSSFNGAQDICVFMLNQDLSQLLWSTYLGGSGDDAGYSISLASDNSLYVCGGTSSHDIACPGHPVQPALAGGVDGIVYHISDNGHVILEATYLGQSQYDQAYLLKCDRSNCPHVFGQTSATDDAWIQDAQYFVSGGGQFLTKLSPQLDSIIWSTAFGTGNGGPDISPTALMVDYCNNIYMSGWGGNTINHFGGTNGLPVTSDALQMNTDGEDFYFICISDDASQLVYASFFGGTTSANANEHVDGGTSRFDRKGRIYQAVCAGCGGQSDFPTTPGAWSEHNRSSNCNLGVIKLDFGLPEVVADFTMPRTVCLPDTVFFSNHSQTVGNTSSFYWDFGDGSSSNLAEPSHFYGHTGLFRVRLVVRDLGSCNFVDTLEKNILVLSSSVDTLSDMSVCQGDYVQIGIPPFSNTSYVWTSDPSIDNIHISNPTVSPQQNTSYSLIVSSGACVDTLIQHVHVHYLNPVLCTDTVICQGDSARLYVQMDSMGMPSLLQWSLSPDFQNPFGEGDTMVWVFPQETTTFYVRMIRGVCVWEGEVTVRVSSPKIIAPDIRICFEDVVQLSASLSDCEDCMLTWTFSDGTVCVGEHPYLTTFPSGRYIVEIQDLYGCKASDSARIVLRVGTFGEPLQVGCNPCEIVEMDTAILSGTDYGADYIYQWMPSADLQDPNSPMTMARPRTTTLYTLIVIDTFGCELSDTLTINVHELTCEDPFVFIPNAFSPNGDGVNDRLFVRSVILKKFYFVIYSHWGQKIFETSDLQEGWDGTFRGRNCQNGVYDYYFRGTCLDGEVYETKGNIMLIR